MKRESLSVSVSAIIIMAVVLLGAATALGAYYYGTGVNHVLDVQQSTVLLNARFGTTNATVTEGNIIDHYHVYVAITPNQLSEGYMNVSSMGNCGGLGNCIGMVFIFPGYSSQCFWMKNTELKLKMTWLNSLGQPTATYNATPFSQMPVCHYAQYVLETPRNFTLNGTMAFGP